MSKDKPRISFAIGDVVIYIGKKSRSFSDKECVITDVSLATGQLDKPGHFHINTCTCG